MWSRILNTELAHEAMVLIDLNAINGCDYHNFTHIEEMYNYLEDNEVPYDGLLDWAILFHDIVYDNQPEKELRSALKFYEMSKLYHGFNYDEVGMLEVGSLIIATAEHSLSTVSTPRQKAIVHADLHALADKVKATHNFVKIMNESMELYDIDMYTFTENNVAFMRKLKETMLLNMVTAEKEDEVFYNDIMDGIDLTIRLAIALRG